MKLNKILMVLAATAIVGCTSDDLNDFTAKQAAPEDSRLVQLDQNFVIAGVGVDGDITRTHWEQDAVTKALKNKFLPIYNATAAAGDDLDEAAELEAQAVGLCWLGQGAVGTDVYTNYQFYHFGWLNNGETEAEIECNDLTNGSLYSDITPLAAVTNGAGGEAKPSADFVGAIPAKSLKAGADNLNYNSGVYKTDNKAIFGGTYIVYYPFNQDFKEAGTIPAKAETTFNNVSTKFDTPEIGQATFRYSAPVTIEGGDQAADFGLYNLSSLVQLRVAAPAFNPVIGQNIDQIVLYSASQKLLKQANLAADKIVAGQKGAALYASTEGTKTITANFDTTDPAIWPVLLQATTSTTITSAYITVLPTTVDDLVVLVHSKSLGQWARVNKPNTVFEAGKAQRLDITVTAADFKSEFIAVDEPSLIAARNEARLVATATKPATVTVIGDITLDGTTDDAANTYNFNTAADAFITYTGDAIIVPEDITLNVATNMVSDVRVLGKSCCSAATTGGRIDVQGGTLNNVTMEPTEAKVTAVTYDALNPMVTYSAPATIAAGKTFDVQAGNVVVNAAVQHKGNIIIAEDAKLTVNAGGDLNFMGSTVDNDGTIEVKKAGKFDMTDSNGNATANDGKRMTNNGTFIHNVDAGVGTAVQSMTQNGEYRCRVDEQVKLDDAFLQWTACSVIEMVNTGAYTYNLGTAKGITPAAYKHNGKFIDFEVNAGGLTTFNNPVVSSGNGDNEDIQIGKLTVEAGGLDVDFVTGKGQRTLTVNGEMYVKAGNTTTFIDSKKINIKQDLTVGGAGAKLVYKGKKANVGGLEVTGTILVHMGTFVAGTGADVDALNITCANFTLAKGGKATFGNRTDGAAKNMVVSGTISNPAGCTFDIEAANQDGNGSVLAWVSCSALTVGGTFTGARPRVE